jgi:hypothetical protein
LLEIDISSTSNELSVMDGSSLSTSNELSVMDGSSLSTSNGILLYSFSI